jgi:hypothetical protein
MHRHVFSLAVSVLALTAAAQDRVPIKRVVLYKNGVGYFEHLGQVRDNQDLAVSFTSGQLDDVLKSLTILDLNGGRITGVTYGSAAPIDKQLDDLHLAIGEKTNLTGFLSALRGARIEIRSGTTVSTGRLLSVERKTRSGGGTTLEVDYVSLITDAGEVRTTELSPGFTVRILDRGLTGRVARYLDLVSSSREPDMRRMVVSTAGTGQRNVFLSYVSEVPVWKTTYRVVLDGKSEPLLQGWAIVDNTVGQDWENVQLSLVAGAPQSFIQKLSQPYYTRRPVVAMPESMMTAPQTFESTLVPGGARLSGVVTDASGAVVAGALVRAFNGNNELVAQTTANASGLYRLDGLPDGPVRIEVGSPGFQTARASAMVSSGSPAQQDVQLNLGAVSQTVEVAAAAPMLSPSAAARRARTTGSGAGLGGAVSSKLAPPPPPPPRAERFIDSLGRVEAATTAQELGDLFEYKLKEPISVRKNQSALVPVVHAKISAEKVSVWNESRRLPRPLRSLWITNSSGLTLDGGSFTVLEDETYTGEGLFDPIRPGEKRLVSYATDLAVTPSSSQSNAPERVVRVRISRGMLIQDTEVRETRKYLLRNEDTAGRTVIVEHPVRAGYELRSETKPVETTAGWMRFRVPLASKQTAALIVDEARPISSSFAVSSITPDQVALFVSRKSINKDIEEALRKVLDQKATVARLEEQKQARDDEVSKIFDDQQRLRENMKALKGSPEEKSLVQRYTRQLDEQETRLAELRKESVALEREVTAVQAELDAMIRRLSFDATL